MVLKNCGPKGYPGMAEVGNMPLPPKVLKKGITDMVRISDARMSGTAYGTVVLHMSPEAAAGGTLALVQNGDEIELDVAKRRLELLIDEELSTRKTASRSRRSSAATGSSISITCCRRTRARISTSSWARAAPSCRATTTDSGLQALLLRAVRQRLQGRADAQPVRREMGAALRRLLQRRDAPEYRAINEMGEVPVLEHRGKRFTQSGVIPPLLPTHFGKFQGERLEVLRWILWDNHKLTSYIATLRYMVTLAKVGETQVHEFLRGR